MFKIKYIKIKQKKGIKIWMVRRVFVSLCLFTKHPLSIKMTKKKMIIVLPVRVNREATLKDLEDKTEFFFIPYKGDYAISQYLGKLADVYLFQVHKVATPIPLENLDGVYVI